MNEIEELLKNVPDRKSEIAIGLLNNISEYFNIKGAKEGISLDTIIEFINQQIEYAEGTYSADEAYKREIHIVDADISEKNTMHFKEAKYDSWFNFLTDSYTGDNYKMYEKVVGDMGEDVIELIWQNSHSYRKLHE